MRLIVLCLSLCALLLAGCGQVSPTAGATAPTTVPATATSAPSATTVPTATPPPTAVPTATTEPTATATAEPTAPPTPVVQVIQAPVAAAPASNPATAASDPARLLIDAIGLDYPLVPVGLDANRVPIVLDHDIAWYKYSARPTQGENVVFWAHVLRFRSAPNKPAPFERLRELAIGARVSVITADGTAHPYAITQQIWAKPEQVEYILPQGREMVTMVSCIGDAVISNGAVTDMSHRLITIAEPVR